MVHLSDALLVIGYVACMAIGVRMLERTGGEP